VTSEATARTCGRQYESSPPPFDRVTTDGVSSGEYVGNVTQARPARTRQSVQIDARKGTASSSTTTRSYPDSLYNVKTIFSYCYGFHLISEENHRLGPTATNRSGIDSTQSYGRVEQTRPVASTSEVNSRPRAARRPRVTRLDLHRSFRVRRGTTPVRRRQSRRLCGV
jgi:hypothetical protein